ncbi:MAG: electron transport complex subunit RsxE [Candidatus Omnitrophota bacterium]|nr:MAG: electron transport complex subunit RsxE [Candidatus Omnitrophota bacterium]
MKRLLKEFTKGISRENPVFIIALGLCPALAVSISLENALGMGAAATFVLVFSNCLISTIRNIVPNRIRIPCFIVVIASFVTIVELLMAAFSPQLAKQLGIFVPLIVVNCIIMGRAESFASKNNILPSVLDGLGMGLGFTLALSAIGVIRELLGSGQILGQAVLKSYPPATIMILPPGALLTLGLLIGLINLIKSKRRE